MADESHDPTPKPDAQEKEDAETRAARRELKQSSISDSTPADATEDIGSQPHSPANEPASSNDAQADDLKEQVASPKKKRAHDQLDRDIEADDNDATSVASTDSGKDRATRLEPEKKRHRDQELQQQEEEAKKASESEAKEPAAAPAKKEATTSSSAFAASGFGKLAAGASPFASFGAPGNKPALSSFASPPPVQPAVAPAPPKMTFGNSGGNSPFAGLGSNSNGFGGSTFGGSSFGSTIGGTKPMSSFAAPGTKAMPIGKPAKPFGAPDSDAEEGDEEDNEGEEDSQPDDLERGASPEKEKDAEEKKRFKLQKVEVDDGEAGESTILSVRAKMFYLDKDAGGWKERGSGMLKINVPSSTVDFDEAGAVIPGSFDASTLDADSEDGETKKGPKAVRLIMRQDQTHRVILNTVVLPAMNFQDKASLKSVGIVFTAFEGPQAKPVNVTMRMTAANAKAFLNEIGLVQKELQNK